MKKAGGLILSIVVAELAGVIGALFTAPSIPGWYAGLAKPSFNPPNGVFGPERLDLFLEPLEALGN